MKRNLLFRIGRGIVLTVFAAIPFYAVNMVAVRVLTGTYPIYTPFGYEKMAFSGIHAIGVFYPFTAMLVLSCLYHSEASNNEHAKMPLLASISVVPWLCALFTGSIMRLFHVTSVDTMHAVISVPLSLLTIGVLAYVDMPSRSSEP